MDLDGFLQVHCPTGPKQVEAGALRRESQLAAGVECLMVLSLIQIYCYTVFLYQNDHSTGYECLNMFKQGEKQYDWNEFEFTATFSGFLSITILSKRMPLSMVQMSMPMESMVGIWYGCLRGKRNKKTNGWHGGKNSPCGTQLLNTLGQEKGHSFLGEAE